MPYPLAELPYGLRCRLSKLSSPLERYNLQIAAGNLSICPPKLQIPKKCVDWLHFRCENATVSLYANIFDAVPMTLSEECLIYFNVMNLSGFDIKDLKSDTFSHFLPNVVNHVILKDCNVTKPFLETLKMMFPKVTSIDISNDNDLSPISFMDVLASFPDVYSVSITCLISKNWIKEILQFGKQLKYITISYRSLELFDEFDCDEFVRFIKAQRSDFRFFMTNRGYPGKFGELHLARLMQCLDQKLKRGNAFVHETLNVIIHFDNDVQIWNLPLSIKCSVTE